MIAYTHPTAGQVYILPYAPNWDRPVELRAAVPTTRSRSLTGREYRTPHGASLRLNLRWTSTLQRADLIALREAMRVVGAAPVICPVWPFAVPGASWPGPVTGGSVIAWNEGWASWTLDPATPSAWDYVAPAVWGVCTATPTLLAPELARVDFTLAEEGDATLAVNPGSASWTTGPALDDASTPPVFPFAVDFSASPQTGAPVVEVQRKTIGRAPRSRAAAFYPQAGAMPVAARITLATMADAGLFLRWWRDMGGDAIAHYVGGLANTATAASTASAGASAITVTSAADLGAYRFLAITPTGGATQWVRVTSIAGNVLNLAAPLTAAVAAGETIIAVAVLARHTGPEATLSFLTPEVATVRMAWEEVPDEYDPAAGETRATTLGAAGLRALLYKFTVDLAGASTVYRYTSFETALTVSGNTWNPTTISHGELSQSIRLDRDTVTIECRVLPWCDEFIPGRLSARVLVEISECSVSGTTGSGAAVIWSGEVSRVAFDGPNVKASCAGRYGLFDRPVPRALMQSACNHTLFDGGCGLSRAAWTFTANQVSASGTQVTLGTWARTGGLPTGWGRAGYFALGYLERSTGARFYVVASTALSAGQITLTLDRDPGLGSGEAVSVVPGCDGYYLTCKAFADPDNLLGRFDNFANFGGMPYLPERNPNMTIPRESGSNYGKK